MMKLIPTLVLAFIATVFVACKPHHDPQVLDDKIIIDRVGKLLENPDKIAYQDVKELVLDLSCVECHSETRREAGVDLTSYENLIGRSDFKKVVFPFEPIRSSLFNTTIAKGDRQMPPVDRKPLLEEQKTLLHTWINNGAKRTPKSVTKRPPTLQEQLQPFFDKPETIDHKTMDQFVFNQHCFRCHSELSEEAEEDVLVYSANLTNYETIFWEFNPVVKKGNPPESSIYRSVAIEQRMPPAADGFMPLDSLLIKLTRLWILNCAIKEFDPDADEDLIEDPENPDKRRSCEEPSSST